jgi:hypothetical protein
MEYAALSGMIWHLSQPFLLIYFLSQPHPTHPHPSFWSIVGQGMFQLWEISQMEQEMCQYLDWKLNVKPSILKEFKDMVDKDFADWDCTQCTSRKQSPSLLQCPQIPSPPLLQI